MADTITPNANLTIITPTRNNWADAANNNFKILDAIVGSYFVINSLRGIWENSTAYAVNDSVIDAVAGTVWRCLVAHTSPAIPAVFSAERVAHPTYWSTYASPARSRGVWVTATSYAVNDFVVNGNQYAICLITHTSGTFATDVAAGKWSVIADFTTPLADAAANAAAALVSAGNAATSEANASTSETNAATSETNASTSATTASTQATNAATSASTATTQATTATTQAGLAATAKTAAELAETNAETAETNAETAETNAAASAAAAAASVAGLSATSTTSLLIATGAKVFTTQSGKLFVAGQFLQIASNADAANYMHGTVTSYAGTTLTMNITDVGGSGTLNDWNISVGGTQGTAGATGAAGSNGSNGTNGTDGLSSPGGRLTPTTLVPVPTAAVTGATSVRYTPYIHNKVPIWNGTIFVSTVFTELTNTLSDATKNPAAVGNNLNYDVFVWSDAGTIRASRGPVWTNDTTRSAGTALLMTQGILVNNVNITNGPLAGFGTYVGTFRSNGTATIDFAFGGSAAGGTAAMISVWNAYNRVSIEGCVIDSTATWAYATTTWRSRNASNGNRASLVAGLQEDGLKMRSFGSATSTSTVYVQVGVGKDITNFANGVQPQVILQASVGYVYTDGSLTSEQPFGFHFYQATEIGNTGVTFGGNASLFYSWRY